MTERALALDASVREPLQDHADHERAPVEVSVRGDLDAVPFDARALVEDRHDVERAATLDASVRSTPCPDMAVSAEADSGRPRGAGDRRARWRDRAIEAAGGVDAFRAIEAQRVRDYRARRKLDASVRAPLDASVRSEPEPGHYLASCPACSWHAWTPEPGAAAVRLAEHRESTDHEGAVRLVPLAEVRQIQGDYVRRTIAELEPLALPGTTARTRVDALRARLADLEREP